MCSKGRRSRSSSLVLWSDAQRQLSRLRDQSSLGRVEGSSDIITPVWDGDRVLIGTNVIGMDAFFRTPSSFPKDTLADHQST